MKNLKKMLVALLLVLTSFSLTSCTQLNKVTTYFEDQGYVRYKYADTGTSLIFDLHDDLKVEEQLRLGIDVESDETTETTETTILTTTSEDDEVVTTAEEQDYFGFDSYVFSNGVLMVIVMEFESEDFLLERLADSEVLQAFFEGQDQADYVNGNCLLVVDEDYMDNYDYFVDIFHGLLDPIEITTTQETTTEAETTTVAD